MVERPHAIDKEPASDEGSSDATLRIDRDDLFHLLQNSRRRAALRYLFEQDPEERITMRNIAEAVAAWEHDTEVEELRSEERQRVYIALYQSHLPKLAEHDIIDYDQNRGTVELRPLAELLRPFLGDGLAGTDTEFVPPDAVPPASGQASLLAKLATLLG